MPCLRSPAALALSYIVHFDLVDSRPPLERAATRTPAHFVMCPASQTGTPRELLQVALETRGPGAWLGSTVLYCAVLCWISNLPSPLIPRSIHSADYARSDNACCPPPSPKPGLKIVVSERVERQLSSLPTSQCMLCPSESGHPGQPAPVWGSSFSLYLPLHNFQWALCNWCCAAGAGAVPVLRGAACCCWLLAAGTLILAPRPRPRPLVSPSLPPSPVSQLASCHNCDGADKPRDLAAIAHWTFSAWSQRPLNYY